MTQKMLGIDIGGTKIAYAVVDEKGDIKTTPQKTSTPKSIDEIKKTLQDIIEEFDLPAAISTAGTVNLENTAVIGSTGNLPKGYSDIDFQALSKQRVFVENDANCAAWAEYKIGASKGFKNSVMLTFGTGVGGGIIVDGKLLKGKSGSAGEMHFPLSRKKVRPCTCGFFDCFEAYASGNGLRKTGIEIFKNDHITTYDIMALAQKNDKKALEALEIWQNDIAAGIVGLANIFDPDCFVFSGSLEQFLDTKAIEDFVNQNIAVQPVKIYHAKAGNHAGLIGAVLLAFEK